MSHVRALARVKGEGAISELVERCGKRVRFKNSDNVPVRTEVLILENVLDMLVGKKMPAGKREFEAGRLHFKNFAETSLGKVVLLFKFKTALMRTPWIAKRVFRGVEFSSRNLDKNTVEITMRNNDYPLEHFHGFFKAWMQHAKFRGTVTAKESAGDYVYTLRWKMP